MLGLIATRGAHGVDGLQILRRRLCDPTNPNKSRLVHIALPEPGTGGAAPMNWVLNENAGQFMMDRAPAIRFNHDQASLLRRILDEILSAPTDKRSRKDAMK